MVNQTRKSKAVAFEFASEDEEEQSSQETMAQAGNMLSRAEKMLAKSNKRRDSQRKALVTEQEQQSKVTKAKINRVFDDRKTRVTKSQRVLWERLSDLNTRRQALEGQIFASMKNFEIQTANIASEIDAVLGARIKEIEEPDAE